MKYLKRFNEELKPSTYMSASRKLKKLGYDDRAKELKDWAGEVEKKEELVKWENNLQQFSPFGIFKLNIKNPETGKSLVGDFYLDITFDADAFSDYPEGGLGHFVGIIPTSEELMNQCNEILPDPGFDNGFYWGFIFGLDFEIVHNQVKFTKSNFWNYDENVSGDVSFVDRTSANKFKNLMVKIYSDPQLGYPSGYNDVENIWEKLNSCILIENSFSSDYGLQLEDIAEYIKSISANEISKKD